MRALAKIGVIVVCIAGPVSAQMPLFSLLLLPLVGVAAIPVAWYVLFTLPAERAEQYEVLQQLVSTGGARRLT